MARPIRSFNERMAEKAKADALETVTTTERLLVLIFVELMNTRRERTTDDLARTLERVFSRAQVAAMLDTTPAAIAVASNRARRAGSAPHE